MTNSTFGTVIYHLAKEMKASGAEVPEALSMAVSAILSVFDPDERIEGAEISLRVKGRVERVTVPFEFRKS